MIVASKYNHLFTVENLETCTAGREVSDDNDNVFVDPTSMAKYCSLALVASSGERKAAISLGDLRIRHSVTTCSTV